MSGSSTTSPRGDARTWSPCQTTWSWWKATSRAMSGSTMPSPAARWSSTRRRCRRSRGRSRTRQDPRSQYAAVIPNFIAALLADRSPTIYGDGEQSRDFTFVDNAVEANIMAMDATGVAGQVFNVACGRRVTLNQLLEELHG